MGWLGNKQVMAKNIQKYMRENNMDRNDLCRIIGVPYSTASDWLNAKTYPRIDKIEAMANHFGISKADLVEADWKSDPNAIPYVRGRRIPILGSIPAGVPMLAEENIEGYDYADVPECEDYFFLRVKGDSMVNAHIFDGDLVLVRSQNCAENGDIVVCLVNGDEATLKRYRQGKDAILLIPENPEYQPIIVPSKDFGDGYARILGVAKEVKHKL